MSIRQFEPRDIESLLRILKATNVFKSIEIEVARELMEICAKNPSNKDYTIRVFENGTGEIRGYYCVGPAPMTETTYDMYWIAVDPNYHDKGIGKQLLKNCEDFVKENGGRLIIAETSSLPQYENTRIFYIRNNYNESGRIKDYYALGDDLVIFSKHLTEAL
jgi:ribosomal protein S18 acetylase RimI-like enzyme